MSEIKEEKKTNLLLKILKVFIIIVLLLILICLIVFGLYKAIVDVADKNADKFDYVVTNTENNYEYKIKDLLSYSYEEDPNNIYVEFPNDYFYECIANINKISSDLLSNYNVQLNRVGVLTNISKKNTFDFYADITYKELVNSYVSGCLRYEIKDNTIDLYVDSISIGDGLPKFISDLLLDFHDGDLVYSYNFEDYEYLKDSSLKLDYISDVTKSQKAFKFKYNYMSNLENIIKRIFKDNGNVIFENIEPMMPIIMEILLGDSSTEYAMLIKDIFPSVYEYLINQ